MYIHRKLPWQTLLVSAPLGPFAAGQSNVTLTDGTSSCSPESTSTTKVQTSSIWQSSSG